VSRDEPRRDFRPPSPRCHRPTSEAVNHTPSGPESCRPVHGAAIPTTVTTMRHTTDPNDSDRMTAATPNTRARRRRCSRRRSRRRRRAVLAASPPARRRTPASRCPQRRPVVLRPNDAARIGNRAVIVSSSRVLPSVRRCGCPPTSILAVRIHTVDGRFIGALPPRRVAK